MGFLDSILVALVWHGNARLAVRREAYFVRTLVIDANARLGDEPILAP
jgi:hypothetical protein